MKTNPVVCCKRLFTTQREASIHEVLHAKQLNPSYGYRRIAQVLRNAHGDVWPTDYAVQRTMREAKETRENS